jgi:uncharacterized membrane protein
MRGLEVPDLTGGCTGRPELEEVVTMMGWDGGWGWSWVALCVTVFLVLGGLIGAAVLVAARGWLPPRRSFPDEDPRRIVDQRFARGELTEAQYLSARNLLEAHPVVGGAR